MVQRKALNKLTNYQLEKYITSESRYVPEAIDMAVAILKERGRIFTDQELKIIYDLKLKNKEHDYSKEEPDWFYEKNIVEDEKAISLYPLTWIFLGSILLTTLFGSILLMLNLIKLKK